MYIFFNKEWNTGQMYKKQEQCLKQKQHNTLYILVEQQQE